MTFRFFVTFCFCDLNWDAALERVDEIPFIAFSYLLDLIYRHLHAIWTQFNFDDSCGHPCWIPISLLTMYCWLLLFKCNYNSIQMWQKALHESRTVSLSGMSFDTHHRMAAHLFLHSQNLSGYKSGRVGPSWSRNWVSEQNWTCTFTRLH